MVYAMKCKNCHEYTIATIRKPIEGAHPIAAEFLIRTDSGWVHPKPTDRKRCMMCGQDYSFFQINDFHEFDSVSDILNP
jgi:hypothetical protein